MKRVYWINGRRYVEHHREDYRCVVWIYAWNDVVAFPVTYELVRRAS